MKQYRISVVVGASKVKTLTELLVDQGSQFRVEEVQVANGHGLPKLPQDRRAPVSGTRMARLVVDHMQRQRGVVTWHRPEGFKSLLESAGYNFTSLSPLMTGLVKEGTVDVAGPRGNRSWKLR